MPELTESEAAARAALLEVESYHLMLDLTAEPVTSRTEVRFRCRVPGAETFADVRLATVREAVLNGRPIAERSDARPANDRSDQGSSDARPAAATDDGRSAQGPSETRPAGGRAAQEPGDGRLVLSDLAGENVLTVEGDATGLSWFEDPADGARYVHASVFPASAGELMACFDQPGLTAALTLELRVPADWECYANGPVQRREAGNWRFAPVPDFTSYLFCFAAGPFAVSAEGVSRRPSIPDAALPRFAETASRARERYQRILGVPAPDPKYDIVFVPGLTALAMSVPGLMLVNETLLARMNNPDDDYAAAVCRHEIAHMWFGSLVTPRWWDDLWLDESMATYLAADFGSDEWAAFGYRNKVSAYWADGLPGSEPVSSPVADVTHALDRPPSLTYTKGASVVRQAAALIGRDALYRGLTDYLTRFRHGTATLDDLVGCWSRASGQDLTGWAEQWLRTPGTPVLRPSLSLGADGLIESFGVVQDLPRTHVVGIGLYDLADDGRLTRRAEPVRVQLSTERTPVPGLAGQPRPDVIVLNDGDLSYARIRFDDESLRALTGAAMRFGDPLTEVVCWNAAWDMVTSAELPAATFADMACRRIRAGGLSVAAAEALTSRAVACADIWAPPGLRPGLREEIAAACLAAGQAEQAAPLSRVGRALAAGFAAAAQSQEQLGVLRSWLDGDQKQGQEQDPDLLAKATFTLAARGLARDEDFDALAARDPANGAVNRATALAMRPDPAAKLQAWRAALSATDRQLARAHATGIWVPGQEDLMSGYRDRYFAEAVPESGPRSEQRRRLKRLLFPATLVSPETVDACAGFADDVIVAEQAAIMRKVLAARSA